MAKPKVIIADEDYSYIIPLQLKFAEEFFDKVDLEIITEKEYLEKLFSTPQNADILIISEEMYTDSIKRHNISNTFIMTEQPTGDDTGQISFNRIFKYTSIKEIFNEITGKSGDIVSDKERRQKSSQIVVVCSACGGTGKTTLAMGISACLVKNYKRVLYINAAKLQNFHRFLDNKNPISTTEIYSKLKNPGADIFGEIQHLVRRELFSYVPPFKTALISLGLDFDVFAAIAESAKKTGSYDFIIVDANTDFDENLAKLLTVADKVIVVSRQTHAACFATNLFVANINGINNEKFIFIENDRKPESENTSEYQTKYVVSEYVDHIPEYDNMKCENFLKNHGMQKAAFLLV